MGRGRRVESLMGLRYVDGVDISNYSRILPTILDVELDPRSESYILVLSMLVDRQG